MECTPTITVGGRRQKVTFWCMETSCVKRCLPIKLRFYKTIAQLEQKHSNHPFPLLIIFMHKHNLFTRWITYLTHEKILTRGNFSYVKQFAWMQRLLTFEKKWHIKQLLTCPTTFDSWTKQPIGIKEWNIWNIACFITKQFLAYSSFLPRPAFTIHISAWSLSVFVWLCICACFCIYNG